MRLTCAAAHDVRTFDQWNQMVITNKFIAWHLILFASLESFWAEIDQNQIEFEKNCFKEFMQ